MSLRNALATATVAVMMMGLPTASQAGGLCPLDLFTHMRAAPAKAAPAKKVAKKPAPKKVAAKPAKPAPKK